MGFAHSAAAAGCRRMITGRSVDLKQTVCSDGRKAVVRSVDLKQNVCIFLVKTETSPQARPAGRRTHVFTTKNAYSMFFVEKVRRNWQACRRAVRPRILETEKGYMDRMGFIIFTFSKSQPRRGFAFLTGFVMVLWLRDFVEIGCLWGARKLPKMQNYNSQCSLRR